MIRPPPRPQRDSSSRGIQRLASSLAQFQAAFNLILLHLQQIHKIITDIDL